MRALPFALFLAAGCGGQPFEAAQLLERPDAEPQEAATEATTGQDSPIGQDAAPDAQDGGVEAGNHLDGGATEADGGASCGCTGDLSNVGDGDFAIAFTVDTTAWPTAPGYMAILNQRSTCSASQPGWDVGMNANGTLSFQVFDGSSTYDNEQSAAVINDGQEHHVVLSRVGAGATIRISVDGTPQTFPGLPVESLTGALAMLQTGTDTLCATDGARPAEPFAGVLTKVCVGPCN